MVSHASGGHGAGTAILSTFSNDPGMRELIDQFVAEMPGRISELRKISAGGDLAGVRRLAHQLKGCCGGYGFPALSDAAGKIEDLLCEAPSGGVGSDAQLKRAQAAVQGLIDLCGRAAVNTRAEREHDGNTRRARNAASKFTDTIRRSKA